VSGKISLPSLETVLTTLKPNKARWPIQKHMIDEAFAQRTDHAKGIRKYMSGHLMIQHSDLRNGELNRLPPMFPGISKEKRLRNKEHLMHFVCRLTVVRRYQK
jgi:hypothetical protein